MNDGRKREDVACRLRNLAQILEGEPLPAIVDRRANELKDDLAALYGEYRDHDRDLADFLKSVAWLVGCLTVEGRAAIIDGAMAKEAELRKQFPDNLNPPTWRDVARLPTFDRETLNRTAAQLRHLALLLCGGNVPDTTLVPQLLRTTDNKPDKQDSDDSWVLANTLWQSKFESWKEAKRFLDKHPDMSKLDGYKRKIHAGRWTSHWAEKGKAGFDSLNGDLPSVADDDDIQATTLAEIAKRKAEVRAQKQARGG